MSRGRESPLAADDPEKGLNIQKLLTWLQTLLGDREQKRPMQAADILLGQNYELA